VTIVAGERNQVAVNQWATSYLSYHDPRMHIGLGGEELVERLEIRWPNGRTEVFRNIAADRYLRVVQGEGLAPDNP
jgi:hypothetical protein